MPSIKQPSHRLDPPSSHTLAALQHAPGSQQTPWQQKRFRLSPHLVLFCAGDHSVVLRLESQCRQRFAGLTAKLGWTTPSIVHPSTHSGEPSGAQTSSPTQHMSGAQHSPAQQTWVRLIPQGSPPSLSVHENWLSYHDQNWHSLSGFSVPNG